MSSTALLARVAASNVGAHRHTPRHRRPGWSRRGTTWRSRLLKDPDAQRQHLFRGSVLLLTNNVAGSLFGFVSWMVISHVFHASDVGVAAAFISTASLVSSVALLGTTTTILRFLPSSAHRRELLQTCLVVAVLATVVLATVVGAFRGAPDRRNPVAWALMFVVFVVLLVTKAVVEAAATAMRATSTVAFATAVGNAGKIVIAVAIGVVLAGPFAVVVLQLVAPTLGIVAIGRRLRGNGLFGGAWRPSLRVLRQHSGYASATYVNGLVGALPGLLMPSLVLHRFGPEKAAGWYLATLIAGVLFLLPAAVGQALMVEGAHDQQSVNRLARNASVAIAAVMLPAVAVAVVLAPLGLRLFGAAYSGSLSCLRLLLLSALLVSANYVAGTVLAVRRRITPLIATNVANAAVVLLLATWWASNLEQLAWAWMAGEVVNVVLFVGFARWIPGRETS